MPKVLENASATELITGYTEEKSAQVHGIQVPSVQVHSAQVYEDPRRSGARIRLLNKKDLRERVGVLTYNLHQNKRITSFKKCICQGLRQQEVDETFIKQEVTDSFVQSCISNNLTVDEAIAILLF